MDFFRQGTFLGNTRIHFACEGMSFSETTYPKGLTSNWHYHQNPYFALVLNGGSVEQRRSQSFICQPAQLLYYDFDEQHRNANYQDDSRNINVEFDRQWLDKNKIKLRNADRESAFIQVALLKMLGEIKTNDSLSELSVELLLCECQADEDGPRAKCNPAWVGRIREILWDQWDEIPSLQSLAATLDLHPVTISRYFSRYFRCTLGDYVRLIKTQKAMEQLRRTNLSLFEIALSCGFSDPSHFNRIFRRYTGFLPGQFRNL